jgi:hypothetical protein
VNDFPVVIVDDLPSSVKLSSNFAKAIPWPNNIISMRRMRLRLRLRRRRLRLRRRRLRLNGNRRRTRLRRRSKILGRSTLM